MTPEKISVMGGMGVVLGVRMSMMHTVVCCPPKGASLAGCTGDKSTKKLNHSAGFEGTVGKIAVVKSSDREHPCCVRDKQYG